jgi:Zn-dependent metalloprotease
MPSYCHDPLRCILPDYVLRNIAERGDETQRKRALDTLLASATLRSARSQAEARQAALPRRVQSLAPLTAPAVDRVVRDAKGGSDLNAPIARREGDAPTGDEAVDEAFDHFGTTWDFFFQAYARNSIDQQGMTLDGIVHYGVDYDNAFWNGSQMAFGDGSGRIFTRVTQSLSVCGHELGHGVIQYDGPLVYLGQSGALNESIADCFGAMVVQHKRGQAADVADWLIGNEILAEGVTGVALRSMKDPGSAYDDDLLGKDPQPGHMDDYVETNDDNGGVHINSGIPNKAFHNIATTLGGNSWEVAGRILYATLGHPRLSETATFDAFARLNHHVAQTLYGTDSREAQAVADGWTEVGVSV